LRRKAEEEEEGEEEEGDMFNVNRWFLERSDSIRSQLGATNNNNNNNNGNGNNSNASNVDQHHPSLMSSALEDGDENGPRIPMMANPGSRSSSNNNFDNNNSNYGVKSSIDEESPKVSMILEDADLDAETLARALETNGRDDDEYEGLLRRRRLSHSFDSRSFLSPLLLSQTDSIDLRRRIKKYPDISEESSASISLLMGKKMPSMDGAPTGKRWWTHWKGLKSHLPYYIPIFYWLPNYSRR